jgi:hypothetical protein
MCDCYHFSGSVVVVVAAGTVKIFIQTGNAAPCCYLNGSTGSASTPAILT